MATGVNVKMGVSGVQQFKNGIKTAQDSVKTLDQALALNEKQFKATGDAEEYMQAKTEVLKFFSIRARSASMVLIWFRAVVMFCLNCAIPVTFSLTPAFASAMLSPLRPGYAVLDVVVIPFI